MNSFLEPTILLKELPLGIFQGFYLKVSEDLFYRTAPYLFVANRLCTVFLR